MKTEGKRWTQYYDQTCYEGNHWRLTCSLGIPGVVIFSAGFPVTCGLLIWKNRQHLNDMCTKLKYGFLYVEYTEENHYWESVILLRKVSSIKHWLKRLIF